MPAMKNKNQDVVNIPAPLVPRYERLGWTAVEKAAEPDPEKTPAEQATDTPEGDTPSPRKRAARTPKKGDAAKA